MREQLRTELESEQRVSALASPPGHMTSGLPELSAAQLTELTDDAKQAEYQRQYRLQMERRNCAGCGDTPTY